MLCMFEKHSLSPERIRGYSNCEHFCEEENKNLWHLSGIEPWFLCPARILATIPLGLSRHLCWLDILSFDYACCLWDVQPNCWYGNCHTSRLLFVITCVRARRDGLGRAANCTLPVMGCTRCGSVVAAAAQVAWILERFTGSYGCTLRVCKFTDRCEILRSSRIVWQRNIELTEGSCQTAWSWATSPIPHVH
jgi:hypothetical protein